MSSSVPQKGGNLFLVKDNSFAIKQMSSITDLLLPKEVP